MGQRNWGQATRARWRTCPPLCQPGKNRRRLRGLCPPRSNPPAVWARPQSQRATEGPEGPVHRPRLKHAGPRSAGRFAGHETPPFLHGYRAEAGEGHHEDKVLDGVGSRMTVYSPGSRDLGFWLRWHFCTASRPMASKSRSFTSRAMSEA